MAQTFDPYHKWLGIAPSEQPPNHYRLLGVPLFESEAEVIEAAADRQMAHLRTYQAGKHGALSQRLLNEVAAARIGLLNPKKRAAYDQALRQKLAAEAAVHDKEAVDAETIGLGQEDLKASLSRASKTASTEAPRPWKVYAGTGVGGVAVLLVAALVFWPRAARRGPGVSPSVGESASRVAEHPDANASGSPGVGSSVAGAGSDSARAGFAGPGLGFQPELAKAESEKANPASQEPSSSSSPHPSAVPSPISLPPDAPAPAVAPFGSEQAKRHQEAWAKCLGVPVEVTNSIGMKLVLIPPGEFQMGERAEVIEQLIAKARARGAEQEHLDDLASEGPQHSVRITKPFYLGVCEVTQGEYQQVTGENPSAFSPGHGGADKVSGEDTSVFPVESVSWDQSQEFCGRLSESSPETAAQRAYRLPTEAEWEYACRAGTTTGYYFGKDRATYGAHGWMVGGRTHPVGQKGANSWGLFDLYGNVWELCADWYSADYYSRSPEADPPGPESGQRRVRRGGCWWSEGRSANRNAFGSRERNSNCGFRVACDLRATAVSLPLPMFAKAPVAMRSGSGPSGEPPVTEASATAAKPPPVESPPGVVWLDALEPVSQQQSHGTLGKNLSFKGRPLTIAERTYEHGLGTHANSEIVFDLGGRFGDFEAECGLDMDMGAKGTACFEVWVDGEKLFESGPMAAGEPARSIKVSVRGKRQLRLVVTDAGDGRQNDHADWCMARLTVGGGRDPLPDEAALAKARVLVDQTYRDEIRKAKTDDQKGAVARRLLEAAEKVVDDAAGCYALLERAGQVATQAMEVDAALEAAGRIAAIYDVDGPQRKLDALKELSKKGPNPASHRTIAEQALTAMEEALTGEAFDAAHALGKLAQSEAGRAREKELNLRVRARLKDADDAEKASAGVKEARRVLDARPDDADANLAVGKYLCFNLGEWDKGLPMLSKGSQPVLKQLAESELTQPGGADQRAALADQWYELSLKAPATLKKRIEERASRWYFEALPGLQGAARSKVESRLERLSPGLGLPDQIVNKIDGSVLVLVPPGKFLAGGPKPEEGGAAPFSVYLPAYYIGVCEVTNAQYKKFMDATGHRPPDPESWMAKPEWRGREFLPECAERPVVCLSWKDAQAYCQWAGLRLPSELEWEKAARGVDGREFPWGNAWDPLKSRNKSNCPDDTTVGVTGFPGARSPFGLYNAAGNAAEFCAGAFRAAAYASYRSGDFKEPGLEESPNRPRRGGSWRADKSWLRCAARSSIHCSDAKYGVGLRVAKSAGL